MAVRDGLLRAVRVGRGDDPLVLFLLRFGDVLAVDDEVDEPLVGVVDHVVVARGRNANGVALLDGVDHLVDVHLATALCEVVHLLAVVVDVVVSRLARLDHVSRDAAEPLEGRGIVRRTFSRALRPENRPHDGRLMSDIRCHVLPVNLDCHGNSFVSDDSLGDRPRFLTVVGRKCGGYLVLFGWQGIVLGR